MFVLFFRCRFRAFFCFAFWLAIILTFYAIFMNACLNSIPWLLNLFQMAVRLQRIVTTQRISKRGKGEHYSRDVEINIGSGRATVSGTMVFLQNQHFVKTLEIYEFEGNTSNTKWIDIILAYSAVVPFPCNNIPDVSQWSIEECEKEIKQPRKANELSSSSENMRSLL